VTEAWIAGVALAVISGVHLDLFHRSGRSDWSEFLLAAAFWTLAVLVMGATRWV
jgi:hypothetical protein